MSLAQKLFCNEKGEISLTKVGVILAALGAALASNPLPPPEVTAAIAKYLMAFGAMFTALGGLSKRGRK